MCSFSLTTVTTTCCRLTATACCSKAILTTSMPCVFFVGRRDSRLSLPCSPTSPTALPTFVLQSWVRDLLPGCPTFIAAQGPAPRACRSFWECIAQHNVRSLPLTQGRDPASPYSCALSQVGVIVMVTNIKEGDRIKCEQYWPDEHRTLAYVPTKRYEWMGGTREDAVFTHTGISVSVSLPRIAALTRT